MSSEELKRLKVLEMVQGAHITVASAARLLAVSERHRWRLLARYLFVDEGLRRSEA